MGAAACTAPQNRQQTDATVSSHLSDSLTTQYAERFSLKNIGNGSYLVDITAPEKKANGRIYHFAFLSPTSETKNIPPEYTIIRTPVQKVICMTALQLSGFIRLHALHCITGVNSMKNVFTPELKERLADGRIVKIGIEGEFDKELVLSAQPDMIFFSPTKRGGYDVLTEVGIPLLPYMGHQERTPLGQAEWIKLVGIITGKSLMADSIFRHIERRYNELKTLANGAERKPTVFSGTLTNGNWYVMGGRSYMAQVFADAGADYILKEDERAGSFNLDFEAGYARAVHADFWRVLHTGKTPLSYASLQQEDARYADFDAFKHRKVFFCHLRTTPYYERMPMEPEIMLADLIKIFHPSLLPQHEAVYYDLLP